MSALIIIPIVLVVFLCVIAAFAWYRIVPQSQAHSVVVPNYSKDKSKSKNFVASPDKNVATNGRNSYFAIPSWLPFAGRMIRVMDITIKELVGEMETYEKEQARYKVTYSLKYRIKDVVTAAETFDTDNTLKVQLIEVIQASVRAITVKYDVTEARSLKKVMSEQITTEMSDDLAKWGLELVNFQLVDFQDTKESSIISDISKRREVAIEARTRQENAEKLKDARVKEALAEETASRREIERDEAIAMAEENKKQNIAEQEKLAEIKRFEVVRVNEIKKAEIEKDRAKVKANQLKEVQSIERETMRLEGEGTRLKLEEEAKGNAAGIREKGLAEAEAKDALQLALNKFGEPAIRALTAELIVRKDRDVGVATAKALETADLKVLSGGDKSGFELGKMIESLSLADQESGNALKNKLARPNDMGLTTLGLQKLQEAKATEEKSKLQKTIDNVGKTIDDLKG